METAFTPWHSLGGGILIGLAATLLMALFGRVLGASGILAGVLIWPRRSEFVDWSWRAALIAGMISAPLAMMLVTRKMPVIEVPVSVPMLLIGGFIVGIGVTFGSGCTSGHGVCGIARLSARSVAATVVFMAVTALTVYVLRHIIGGP